jgi:hypothetical protein
MFYLFPGVYFWELSKERFCGGWGRSRAEDEDAPSLAGWLAGWRASAFLSFFSLRRRRRLRNWNQISRTFYVSVSQASSPSFFIKKL